MHYLIIIFILGVIIIYQIKKFTECQSVISSFRDIFPDEADLHWEVLKDNNGALQIVSHQYLDSCKKNPSENQYVEQGTTARAEIINSINDYLSNNANSTSDFYLIKDIVDRNCDTEEEEIQSLTPEPLYLGLMGTMAGIIVGVGYLVFSGDLKNLLSATSSEGSANGIETLLGGVAIAMVCSILGLILTIWNSSGGKDAKNTCERNKHRFLTFIQTELLPVMTTDAASAMRQMTENLTDFNKTFSQNTKELKSTLGSVLETSQAQAQLIDNLRHIDINKIARANIDVYEKLKNCSEEIGALGDSLSSSTEYISQVNELNRRLKDTDDRVRMIEEMANFFKTERANMERMNGVISEAVGGSHMKLQKACNEFENATSDQITALTTHSQEQMMKFKELINAEADAVSKRVESLAKLTEELQKMGDVKKTMQSLEAAVKQQSDDLKSLSKSIVKLAEVKTTGVSVPMEFRLPKWFKVMSIITFATFITFVLFILTCLILASLRVI